MLLEHVQSMFWTVRLFWQYKDRSTQAMNKSFDRLGIA